ncbi:MAG: hypothetical protein ACLFPV_08040 [Spirochaetaceae bacterium]
MSKHTSNQQPRETGGTNPTGLEPTVGLEPTTGLEEGRAREPRAPRRNSPPRPPRRFPAIDGFDLNAGPLGLDDPERVRRSRILGNLRQEAPAETLPPLLRSESLSREFKDLLTLSIGPGVRGGEDLPPLSDRQIEVVRFRYTQTIHREAWSFRGTQSRERIYFDVADEYDLNTEPALGSSRAWPSLGKLIWILDRSEIGETTGLYFGDLSLRLGNDVEDPEELRDFIKVSSFFYPAIGEWYDAAFEAWCRAIAAGADLPWPVDSISLMEVM